MTSEVIRLYHTGEQNMARRPYVVCQLILSSLPTATKSLRKKSCALHHYTMLQLGLGHAARRLLCLPPNPFVLALQLHSPGIVAASSWAHSEWGVLQHSA